MKENEKMTLEEYQEKYTQPENTKLIKTGLFLLIAGVGLVFATCLTLLVFKLFDIHEIAGYVGIGVAVLLFAVLFILPVVKIQKTKAFKTNINARTAKEAQKYNRQVRLEIADKMIDYYQKVEGASWYNDNRISQLMSAKANHDNNEIKRVLTDIYNLDVKKISYSIIRSHAVQVGIATALSQSDMVDTMFAVVYDLDLIKQHVYLYGFRPSDAKMLKIYKNVLINAITAYGLSKGLSSVVGVATKAIQEAGSTTPLVGALISFAGSFLGSAVEGTVNALFAAQIGTATRKYLMQEYNMQNLLDGIDLGSDEEDAKMMKEIGSEIKQLNKSKGKREKKDDTQSS